MIGCPARDPAAGGGVRGGAVRRRDRGQLGGARAVRGRGARGPAVPRHQVGVRADDMIHLHPDQDERAGAVRAGVPAGLHAGAHLPPRHGHTARGPGAGGEIEVDRVTRLHSPHCVQGAGQDSAQLTPALSVGVAYTAALTAHRGTLNPALALGQVSQHTAAVVVADDVVVAAGLRAHHQLPVHAAVDLLAGARPGRGVRGAVPGGDRAQ